jgi:predicted 2-oxoglutarate/Fe(II)-dependent dioxygenase YbiX
MTEKIILEFPRISVFENAIPLDVCDAMIAKYKDAMNPNAGIESREQTYGQITEEVEQRSISWDTDPADREYFKSLLAKTVGIPESHVEAGDIYFYETGQYFGLHHDYPYDPKIVPYYSKGGDRKATAIFWFNDDYEGGEIYFPKQNFEHRPKSLSAIFFPGNKYEYLHGVKEITKGNRFTALYMQSTKIDFVDPDFEDC